jgi:polysaccharide deacetylase
MKKTICFTIDVEPDFSGLLKKDVYYGRQNLLKLENIVKKNDIKLTAFVTGKTLEDDPEILSSLEGMKAEIECHSYAHRVDRGSKIDDIERGIRTFEELVGRLPYGYRAPEGIITKKEALFLDSKGIKFDSSISPAFLPGRYNHLQFPVQPFKIKGSNLLELPLPVVPKIRIPFNFSFVQLLGFGTFSLLLRVFGWPNLLIFNIHPFELGRIPSYYELPLRARAIYFRAQRIYKNPAQDFDRFVRYLSEKGYEKKYMLDVYEELKYSAPSWGWVEN